MSVDQIAIGTNKNFIKLNSKDEKQLKKSIGEYLIITQHAFNVQDVTDYVNSELTESFPSYFIQKFMKSSMRLTYKKVKPRPNNINLCKLEMIRVLFSIKITKLLNDSTLVINMDQSSINRHMKSNRSWGLRGAEIECKNSNFSGSVSLCMAILSNGSWFWLMTDETIEAQKIIQFLWNLSKWLSNNCLFSYANILLMLDNCSVQKSKDVKELLKQLNWTVVYLPVYSPVYAPIENCFGIMKSHLKSKFKREEIKINLKHNYAMIYEALKSIKSRLIKNLFANLYSRIRQSLNNLS